MWTPTNMLDPQASCPPSWLAPDNARRFAVVRICLGLVLLADVVHLYTHLRLFPTTRAWPVPLGPMLLLWAAILICMIAGYRTRIACVGNYICCALVLGILAPNGGFQQAAGDSLAIGWSLLAVVLPCAAVFSVDRLGATITLATTIAAWRWLLVAYLSSVYIDSALHKIFSPMWSAGFGAATPMGLPSLVWTSTAWMAFFPPLLFRLLGWGVIGFELLFPLLYAWYPSRLPAVLAGMALHLGIAIVYPIPVFGFLMIAGYLALLPDRWYGLLSKTDLKFQTHFKPGAELSWLTSRWIAAMIVVWILAVGATYAPQFVTYRPLSLFLKTVRKAVYITTGIASHAVFEDNAFLHYQYQLRLVPTGSAAPQVPVPYSRNGLVAWSIRDRVWEQWWKRTQSPSVSLHEAEFLLPNWARYYSYPAGEPIMVRIEARPQEVLMNRIDTSLFSRNNAVSWRLIGSFRLGPGVVPLVHWSNKPQPDEVLLGGYLLRVLAETPQ